MIRREPLSSDPSNRICKLVYRSSDTATDVEDCTGVIHCCAHRKPQRFYCVFDKNEITNLVAVAMNLNRRPA